MAGPRHLKATQAPAAAAAAAALPHRPGLVPCQLLIQRPVAVGHAAARDGPSLRLTLQLHWRLAPQFCWPAVCAALGSLGRWIRAPTQAVPSRTKARVLVKGNRLSAPVARSSCPSIPRKRTHGAWLPLAAPIQSARSLERRCTVPL